MGLMSLYHTLPRPLREGAKSLAGLLPLEWRLGHSFFELTRFLDASQRWTPAQLAAWQDEQVAALVRHAVANVPYWRTLFKELGLTPNDVRCVADLPKLPILTKDIVREHVEQMVAENMPRETLLRCNTSGTTGKPLFFYYEKSKDFIVNDPYIWRYFNWGGHRLGQRRATLSAWALDEGVTWNWNPVRRLLVLSAYRLTPETVREYARAIERHGIGFIDGYPSSLERFTQLLEDQGIPAPRRMGAVFTHSEYLYDWQRERLERYWGGKCFDWYAMEERVILGQECEQHHGHHLIGDFAVTEFVPDASDPETAGNPEAPQRLIATSLTNYAMPFIRYETGDVGRLAAESCPCGRPFPLLRLGGGRKRNFAVGADGSYISITNIDIPSASERVAQFQFVQESPGTMQLRVVRKPGFGDADVAAIHANLHAKFGSNIAVTVTFVDSVESTGNRKTPLFIQRIEAVHQHAEHR